MAFALVIGFGLGFSGCSKTEEMELSQINELSNEVDTAMIQKTVTRPWTGGEYVDGKVGGTWNDTIINDPKTFNQLIGERDGDSAGIISYTLLYLSDYDPTLRKWTPEAAYYEIETDEEKCPGEIIEQADEITYKFLQSLPKIREYLSTDVEAAYNGDPAAFSTDEIIFCYPGMFAITTYRIAHELYLLGVPLIPRIISEHAHNVTGIDIHPGASIGKYFFIDHGTGVVIGETTVIGNNVKIYQGVTLGALSTRKGQQLKGVKRHPTLGDNVTIYSGTSVLGGETVIGDGTTIGGNAFVVSSVSQGMKVSVRNPELEFQRSGAVDLPNGEYWDWII